MLLLLGPPTLTKEKEKNGLVFYLYLGYVKANRNKSLHIIL